METTYWHVVTGGEWDGGDLLPFQARLERGEVTEADWRWEHALGTSGDEHRVSLWASEREAREYASEHGGELLVVTLPDDFGAPMLDEEGHPAVLGRIPAEYIERAP